MNITSPSPISLLVTLQVPPVINQLGQEILKATVFDLIPLELLFFSIYFNLKGFYKLYRTMTFLSIATFWLSPNVAPISCGPVRCLQHFATAVGTMKALDLWTRRHSFPAYTAGRRPADWLLALILITELRYESFTPNFIRVPRKQENFNEPLQLIVHIAAFAFLQALPQEYPTILAFEVQLSIYILWTSLQLLLRYKSSPALFGPLYKVDSLTGFWSETWHNAFASPCTSLAYGPLRHGLPKLGVPVVLARSMGVIGAFGLMAAFHVYALSPILSTKAVTRIGLFFVLNGVGTVAEAMVWGHKKHSTKAVLAWVFETSLATWTAREINIPNGLSKIPWREVCRSGV
ncbi:hypothetical protein BJ875DRAFT_480163 [Amylocarpus encephaloides]|uniref:Wax synthase domain-containing protein n=1 Tax=Amylocarpus encephaloides TaxID=45428 RepID=A0A9P8C9A3_9HELO|nr:hypothetical protein BJ875DRAFT_480163 [Amylocarpus encephaloides]